MPWVDVNERLPEPGEEVHVRGQYTPGGHGYPLAYIGDPFNNGQLDWCSREWRGMVGVTHWWEE